MRKIIQLWKMLLVTVGFLHVSSAYSETSFYSFTATTLDGTAVDLKEYEGKVALVVNTASKCGFTSQYEDLEKLHKDYSSNGFVVLGFPSNDFLGQEPGNNEEIKKFCRLTYGVTFPMFAKGVVRGESKQPIYKFLTESDPRFAGEVQWNFTKFLIDKSGKVVDRFSSMTKPLSDTVIKRIDEEIAR